MSLRFTRLSIVLPLAAAAVVACAAHGSDDVGTVDANTGTGDDDSGGSVPTEYDSGPPATIGGGHDGGADGAGGGDSGSHSDSGPGGSCNVASDCPGAGKPNAAVACNNHVCVLSCNGENYDVNADPNDGCEIADDCASVNGTPKCPVDNHTNALATDDGSYPCDDGSSAQNMTGYIPSDARDHEPAIDGFDTTTGAAPDYFKITGSGGVCQNDANVTLQMDSPTKQSGCYELHLLTDKNNGGQSCTTDLTGSCSITNGSGSYGDGSTLYVWVKKTSACPAAQFPDHAHFHISGHL
jgi:hypothetical protein